MCCRRHAILTTALALLISFAGDNLLGKALCAACRLQLLLGLLIIIVKSISCAGYSMPYLTAAWLSNGNNVDLIQVSWKHACVLTVLLSITRRPLHFFAAPARVEAYDGENCEMDQLAA